MVDVYQVVLTLKARESINDIFHYLEENVSETTALNVVNGIADEIQKLEKLPTGRPIVHAISDENETYRFILKWKYKIIFFVDEDSKTVEVIAVKHGNQSPERLKDLLL